MRACAFVLLLTACAGLEVVPLPPEAEVHRVTTDDGWTLVLTRYHAVGPSTGRPVLLCHGISANDRNMDLDEHHSLARWLAAQGREAWTMSLRATGNSDGPSAAQGRPDGFSFDAYWQHDLPTAIAFVRKTTAAELLDFVGHSMGGIILYAYLAEGGQGIGAAATMGTPTRLDWGTGVEPLLSGVAPLVPEGWSLPSALGAHLIAPFQQLVSDDPVERFFFQPETMNRHTWQRLMAYGTADMSTGVLLQLLLMLRDGRFASADGKIDYRADMAHITRPVLVVAARLDRLALTPAVRDGYRALGGPKEWLLISRANGARGEYGHMDLVAGEYAAQEVWSQVLDFFNRHRTN
jgi:poly(3-hydroxyalkanoate) synthetase